MPSQRVTGLYASALHDCRASGDDSGPFGEDDNGGSVRLVEARAVTKSFAGTRALRGVDFELLAGEVHALVGENGAGKSTLIKIITGAVAADSGLLELGGRVIQENDPGLARALGVVAIYQQPALFPDLTVAENIAIALEGGGAWRRIDWRERHRRATELLKETGCGIAPDRLVSSLSMPEQQIVEIAKAIGAESKILILDEPTASLTERETERLFEIIARLRGRGAGIIYISHRLEEIERIADRITVLRDGETIGTRQRGEVGRGELIGMMAGGVETSLDTARKSACATTRVVMEVKGRISFTVRAGEILGFAGLVGSGRTEMAEMVFGISPAESGEIWIDGQKVRIESPADAIRVGIGYVPEDRRRHGVILELPIAANTSLADLKRVSRRGLINRGAERSVAVLYAERLRIKASSVDSAVNELSGGNQQKVALARWLAIGPKVLILDEPTQGVDVGAKAEIHSLIGELAAAGMAVLLISSEMEEVLALSDRVAVMRGGSICGIFSRGEATGEKILGVALGVDEALKPPPLRARL